MNLRIGSIIYYISLYVRIIVAINTFLVYRPENDFPYAIGLRDADVEGVWEWQHIGKSI